MKKNLFVIIDGHGAVQSTNERLKNNSVVRKHNGNLNNIQRNRDGNKNMRGTCEKCAELCVWEISGELKSIIFRQCGKKRDLRCVTA